MCVAVKIRRRSEKNITSVTLNAKLFRDFGPLEPYFVVGVGLVTLTQILFVAATSDEEFDQSDKQDHVSFHARVGVGLHFPVTKHLFGYAKESGTEAPRQLKTTPISPSPPGSECGSNPRPPEQLAVREGDASKFTEGLSEMSWAG